MGWTPSKEEIEAYFEHHDYLQWEDEDYLEEEDYEFLKMYKMPLEDLMKSIMKDFVDTIKGNSYKFRYWDRDEEEYISINEADFEIVGHLLARETRRPDGFRNYDESYLEVMQEIIRDYIYNVENWDMVALKDIYKLSDDKDDCLDDFCDTICDQGLEYKIAYHLGTYSLYEIKD